MAESAGVGAVECLPIESATDVSTAPPAPESGCVATPREMAEFLLASGATKPAGYGCARIAVRVKSYGKKEEAARFRNDVTTELRKLRPAMSESEANGIAWRGVEDWCRGLTEEDRARAEAEVKRKKLELDERAEARREKRVLSEKHEEGRHIARQEEALAVIRGSTVATAPSLAEPPNGPPTDTTTAAPPDGEYDPTFNLVRDIVWAQENRLNKSVTKKDAPSLSAWDTLQFARENRNDFYKHLLPRAFVAKEKKKAAADEDESGRDMSLDEVERLLLEVERDR